MPQTLEEFVSRGRAAHKAAVAAAGAAAPLEDAFTCACGCPEDVHRVDGRCTACRSCLDFDGPRLAIHEQDLHAWASLTEHLGEVELAARAHARKPTRGSLAALRRVLARRPRP
jgi:hypothetical protein